MKRIATANRAVDLFGPGKDGFKAAVPGVSDATYFSAIWANSVQEAIVRTIEASGRIPSDDYDLFVAAIRDLIEARIGDFAIDTGVANAYVVAMNPPINAYTSAFDVRFRATHANTGACTLNAGGGDVSLLRNDGSAMQPNDILQGSLVSAQYDPAANVFLMTSMAPSQAKGIAQFGANGSFTVPSGVTKIWVSGCAGGGAGGGGAGPTGSGNSAGGGGGGGAGQSVLRAAFTVTPGQVIPITIGAGSGGGLGGPSGSAGNSGANGGNTVIGSLLTLVGGGGGGGGGLPAGGAGGAGHPRADDGDDGAAGGGSGAGASSLFGVGGSRRRGNLINEVGGDGYVYGAGGGGGAGAYSTAVGTGGAGGNGAPGVVIIEW